MPTSPLSRVCSFLAAVLLLAGPAPQAFAQDEEIQTEARLPGDAIERMAEQEEVDAESIIGMLNEGLFALECASPKKMRAIIMFLTEDDVVRVAGEPVEMEPGRHSAEGVMPGDDVNDVWSEVTGGEVMRPDTVDVYTPESAFSSEEEIADVMREELEIGDGRVGLIMFLTVADREMAEEMGDALQIRPAAVTFSRAE